MTGGWPLAHMHSGEQRSQRGAVRASISIGGMALKTIVILLSLLVVVNGQTPQPHAQKQRVEAEFIHIDSGGFHPRSITRTPRIFFLIVRNYNDIRNLTISLNQQGGGNVRHIPMQDHGGDWSEALSLPPGTYVLTEDNHPAWRCTVTISPH